MGRHGHRNMFYATGLPGWMRFGYSPGWGRMPPGAQYIQEKGQMPQAMNWLQKNVDTLTAQVTPKTEPRPNYPPTPAPNQTAQAPQLSKMKEIELLENEVRALEDYTSQIMERIKQLQKIKGNQNCR